MNAGDVVSGRYEIASRIGQGGMQEVFKATDRVVDRQVAVKTPLEGQTHRRFKQSAILAARVNNHGIAKTLDYFEENDRPFLVEEFVEGETLDKAIIEFAGYVDPPLAAILFGKLAKGIRASHHVGVVHRDLKPSNIMVTGGLSLDAVKITDFGIATLAKEIVDQEIEENVDITKSTSGTVKGAIPFMSPEMLFRKPGQHIDSPADIWSLGCIMFYACTGRHPFGVGMDAVLAIGTGERLPWSKFMTSNAQFQPVAEALQTLIERCLDPNPSSRPSADTLSQELSELCVFSSPRFGGIISSRHPNYAKVFFIENDNGGSTMLHKDSVFGPNSPELDKRVVFASFPGNPQARAFPVLVQRAKPEA
ncbi:MAG: serine/threonine-protein kinase [Pseudomonadota bacterium]